MNSGRILAAKLLVAILALAAVALPGGAASAAEPAVISVPPPSSPPPASPRLEQQADLSPFVGRPISKIEVSVDDDTWTLPEPPRVASVHPGQTMSGQTARRAMDELLESGRFARARVVAVLDGAGARLVVHVVQRRLIETLRLDFHGAPLDRDDLLREADLVEGGEFLGVDVPAYTARIERYLARRGFPTSSVSIQSRETDDPTRVLVIVDALPGGARILQRRAFYVFGADARVLAPVLDGYRVGVGERADENAFDAADTAMEARLRALGYQKADVSHDLVFADDLVTLRVRVDAGPRFEPRFEGNEHYDATALAGALGLDEEADLAPGHLVQKVRDFYVKRGFLDVEVTFETRGVETDLVHLLVFHVIEHRRVKVGTRSYPCVKEDEIRRLTGGGPRSPGEIGGEIDSYLDEELPGADLFRNPDPRGLDATITHPQTVREGTRAEPLDLQPDATFAPDTYDRALLHVQELYRNEGYLHAEVGPVNVLRRQCDRRSPPGRCTPVPFPSAPPDACTYDATDLPLPVPALDPSFTCTPDPGHGVECEEQVTLRIPVKLGPRTMLYDLQFAGAHALSESRLGRATELLLGEPANNVKLEDARRKLVELYREEGYAYADVKYALESSPDHTRARARFDVVEGDQVIVQRIVIRGNARTSEGAIRRRIALEAGKPYRTSAVRKTQERIATLNVFSNVNVALEEPYVPQRSKVVIVTVSERKPQSLDPLIGLSTGEGIRGELGYTHSNIAGEAIGFSARVRLSYLPDELIFDSVVRQNFRSLCDPNHPGFCGKRLAYRVTGGLSFPEIGFGPLVRLQIDGVAIHDLEHDFALDKYAGIPALYYRPFREVQFALSQSVEHNEATIFGFQRISDYLASLVLPGQSIANFTELSALLRFPNVPSHLLAQRLVVTWDRRDDTFHPHRGTFFVSGVEHADWYAEASECTTVTSQATSQTATTPATQTVCNAVPGGHTLRFTETIAAYVPVTRTITLAAELRTGMNVQLKSDSATYPDRLFFLGGSQSMRGYLQDSMVTQEDADHIASDPKFTINQVAIRGGNLMINPKLELRIPVKDPIETVLFMDSGNIWQDPSYIQQHGLSLRTSAGTGLRFVTPIGPLALDYGINLSRLFSPANSPRRNYEDFGAFHFAIGLF